MYNIMRLLNLHIFLNLLLLFFLLDLFICWIANSADFDQTAPVGAVWSRSPLFGQELLS